MRSIYVTTTAIDTPECPWAHSNYIRVIKAAGLAIDCGYSLSLDPGQADIILFVDPRSEFQTDILLSPLYLKYPHKSMVLDFHDSPSPVVPGLYVGLNKAQSTNFCFQGSSYIRVADNHRLQQASTGSITPDLLYSFIGKSSNDPTVRPEVLRLQHPRALLIDRNSNQSESDLDYVQILARSKFILCPRGLGASSWRLFETMRIGRVPVVISDDWVPPMGINWDSFLVQVPERDIRLIPSILTEIEDEWIARSQAAWNEWERCLSYERMFDWIGDRGVSILDSMQKTDYRASLPKQLSRVSSPRIALRLLREWINGIKL